MMNYNHMPVCAAACSSCQGVNQAVMPDYFPVGMAYVPWQTWEQPYSLEQGLNRGTIFPELDLPFVMGRCM